MIVVDFNVSEVFIKIVRKINKLFNRLNFREHRKMLSVITLGVISLLVVVYVIYSLNKISYLSKTNSFDSLELFILNQSLDVFKENKEKDHEALVSLSKRIDHIIHFGSDDADIATINMSKSTNNSVQVTPTSSYATNLSQSQVNSVTITPAPQSSGALGTLEVYDPTNKTVNVYKDASTISQQSSIMAGITVPYFKIQTDWYLIQTQENPQQLWWIYFKNVRGVK